MYLRQTLLASCLLSVSLFAQAQVTMTIDATRRGPLTSPYQYGLFFEEINHAGDGGLYAELVKNRAFDEGTEAWSVVGGATTAITTDGLLNAARRQALTVNTMGATASAPRGVRNTGFWGMAFRPDSTYTLTLWLKASPALQGHLRARLVGDNGTTIVGSAPISGTLSNTEWTKLSTTITATGAARAGSLQIVADAGGEFTLGVVSLFPYTWKNRANGLRPDLAQLLADTRPSFLRFPGGCYVEGMDSYDNAFQWKKTIGPIEARPGHMNRNWGYWSSDGLGYDEYLQLCEDLGAAPMFVVNIGVGHNYAHLSANATQELVQDALDAIEYANGDASTFWGRQRIANGHAEPYGLKMIEVGNENGGDSDYGDRYKIFYDAIHEAWPDIILIGNGDWGAAPTWNYDTPTDYVDKHYYESPQWMLKNYTKYDGLNPAVRIYNGEYAANAAGTYGLYGNMNSALGEAAFMLGMEKNSNAVGMASFAPIFTHENNPAWPYDMIHFNAAGNFVTPSYYVQKLMTTNLGTQNLLWTETGNQALGDTLHRFGMGTWNTAAEFDDVSVTTASGSTLAQADFSSAPASLMTKDGSWQVTGGVLAQTALGTNFTAVDTTTFRGDVTYKVRARKTAGNEGFLIIFNYQDDNNYCWWNLGGWNNTSHGVEQCVGGSKTTLASASGRIETNRWYDIEIRLSGNQVTCLLDNQVVHQFTLDADRNLYQSVQLDTATSELIVKAVNPHGKAQALKLDLKHMQAESGRVVRLASAQGTDENTMSEPNKVAPTEETLAGVGGQTLSLDVPPYSLNIYRLKVTDVEPAAPAEPYVAEYEAEDSDKTGYLFAHMNRSREITNYALSRYGHSWTDLLDGDEVFDTKAVTTTGGMRDAYVFRLQEGGFMLAGTDMTSRLGWTSNHIMDLMISPDLVHWTKVVKIDLESAENLKALGGITASEMTAAWAPQVIYDPVTKHYVLYYSVGFPDRHRIYYQLIDAELNILTEPRLYFDPGYDIIDADIVWNAKTRQYMMVYKCEQASGFNRATATTLVPTDAQATGTTVWTITDGFHVSDNNQSIEAPTQWRAMGSDSWNLSYINYSGSGYGYKTRTLDADGLNPGEPVMIGGKVAAQHGSILKITEAEYQYLLDWEQVKTLLPQAQGYYQASKNATIAEAVRAGEEALENSTTFDENAKAMSGALALLKQTKAIYDEYVREQTQKGEAADLTSLIVNPDFAQGSVGWTPSPSFTNADGNVAEFWNTAFDFHQTLARMPKGVYELSVQSFYRYGSINNATTARNNGSEELLCTLYANGAGTTVMSLYDETAGKVYGYSPYTFPDNVTQANEAFNSNGLYTNTLRVELAEEGDLTIGIRKDASIYADWCCFDNFKLRYLGTSTAIGQLNDRKNEKTPAWYTISGQRVDNTGNLPKGVYVSHGKKVVR